MNLPDFLIIPIDVVRNPKLQPLDREVYGVVYWASKFKEGKCIMSNQTIADILNSIPTSISRSLKRLFEEKYIDIKYDPATKERLEIIPWISMMHNPNPNGQGGLIQMDNRIVIYNNNKEKKILKKENQQEDKDNSSFVVGDKLNQFSEISSRSGVVPMTALERWEMAKELDVPLWIVKQTEKNFWDYIETPKGKSKHYKTTYKTVKKWIEMKLQKGEFQNCNETEKLQLDMQHPDIIKQRDELFAWAKEQKITE